MSGILFGVGVGPGDPELVTLKAVLLLNECEVLAYPSPESGQGMAFSIALPHLKSSPELLPLRLPVMSSSEEMEIAYDQAAALLRERLKDHEKVVVLCEGDPFFYSSFINLYDRLQEHFEVRVVPGVSSPMACSAVTGRPLVSKQDSLSIIPGTLSEANLIQQLKHTETAVIMKMGSQFKKIYRVLKKLGLLKDAVCVERATLPDQRVRKLEEIEAENIPYFSTILVRKNHG